MCYILCVIKHNTLNNIYIYVYIYIIPVHIFFRHTQIVFEAPCRTQPFLNPPTTARARASRVPDAAWKLVSSCGNRKSIDDEI